LRLPIKKLHCADGQHVAVVERLQLMKLAAAILGANMQQRQKLACSEIINKARCGSC
jgi:hypothetical protein